MNTLMGRSFATLDAIELIEPFTRADDARLRGNAAFALITLLNTRDGDVHRDARRHLLRLLTDDFASDMDWQRRFALRAVQALGELNGADQKWLAQEMFALLWRSRDRVQKKGIGRIVLSSIERGQRIWSPNWRQYLRVVELNGRPQFFACLGRTFVRCAVAGLAVGALLLAAQPMFTSSSDYSTNAIVEVFFVLLTWLIGLTVLSRWSVPGGLKPQRWVVAGDVVFAMVVFSVTGYLSALWVGKGSKPPDSLVWFLLLGALTGLMVRSIRWLALAWALENDRTAPIIQPTACFCATALLCLVVNLIGHDNYVAGASLLVLAPASAVAASLDVWLETEGARRAAPLDGRSRIVWASTLVLSTAILVAYWLGMNLMHALPKSAEESAEYRNLLEHSLVVSSTIGAEEKLYGQLGKARSIRVPDEGTFLINVGDLDGDLVMRVQSPNGQFKKMADDPDPPSMTVKLPAGNYFVCVESIANKGDTCGLAPGKFLNSSLEVPMCAVSGEASDSRFPAVAESVAPDAKSYSVTVKAIVEPPPGR